MIETSTFDRVPPRIRGDSQTNDGASGGNRTSRQGIEDAALRDDERPR
jgi:hypothetical protein